VNLKIYKHIQNKVVSDGSNRSHPLITDVNILVNLYSLALLFIRRHMASLVVIQKLPQVILDMNISTSISYVPNAWGDSQIT